MKLFLTSLILLSLTACGVVQQKQRDDTMLMLKIYCDSLYEASDIDVVRNKIAIRDARKPTFEMLTLNKKPTEEEKKGIKKFAEAQHTCRQKWDEEFFDKGYLPNYKIIVQSYADIGEGFVADLYNGHITYAELNKARQKNSNEMQAALVNEDERVLSRNAAAAQRNYQNYMTLQQNLNQQRIINNMNRPITCNRIGNSTYCN
jgi:hypothetical protein